MVGAVMPFWLAAHQPAVDDVKTTLPYFFCLILLHTSQLLLHFLVTRHSLTSEKISTDLHRASFLLTIRSGITNVGYNIKDKRL